MSWWNPLSWFAKQAEPVIVEPASLSLYRLVYDREGKLVCVGHGLQSFGSPDAEASLDIQEARMGADEALWMRQVSLECGGDGFGQDAVMVLEEQLKDPEFRESYIRAVVTGKLDAAAQELTRV
jgi:hypothetical protein